MPSIRVTGQHRLRACKNALVLPQDTQEKRDYALLSDILPTGYHGTEPTQVSTSDQGVTAWDM